MDTGTTPTSCSLSNSRTSRDLLPADWKPTFPDYLFVSLTSAIAFSPTDAMPYSKRAKLVMGIESTLSFVIAAMLVARAVNIAHG